MESTTTTTTTTRMRMSSTTGSCELLSWLASSPRKRQEGAMADKTGIAPALRTMDCDCDCDCDCAADLPPQLGHTELAAGKGDLVPLRQHCKRHACGLTLQCDSPGLSELRDQRACNRLGGHASHVQCVGLRYGWRSGGKRWKGNAHCAGIEPNRMPGNGSSSPP